MTARVVDKSVDYDAIKRWIVDRNADDVSLPPVEHIPENGWIVDDTAAIFLYDTDSEVAVLDYFVSNPQALEADRLKACDLLIVEAVKKAKELGKTVLYGHTAIHKVIALGFRYGFKADRRPYYFFRKNLKESEHGSGSD